MRAILSSFFLVAISELGDKTQLLALSLAARFRRPWLVLAGVLTRLADRLPMVWIRRAAAALFLAFAAAAAWSALA
jgi:putative Ca2+/H+ antiporter (TMEM165/GDT1 family)